MEAVWSGAGATNPFDAQKRAAEGISSQQAPLDEAACPPTLATLPASLLRCPPHIHRAHGPEQGR